MRRSQDALGAERSIGMPIGHARQSTGESVETESAYQGEAEFVPGHRLGQSDNAE